MPVYLDSQEEGSQRTFARSYLGLVGKKGIEHIGIYDYLPRKQF